MLIFMSRDIMKRITLSQCHRFNFSVFTFYLRFCYNDILKSDVNVMMILLKVLINDTYSSLVALITSSLNFGNQKPSRKSVLNQKLNIFSAQQV